MIVTGASRGIGAAIARAGGAAGYAVCVNYNASPDKAEAVVADITAAGGRAVAVQADMAREADIVRLFETCERDLGPVTALVNNAGVTARSCLVEDVDAETLDTCFRINISAYFLCAREAVRRMSTKHGGQGGAIVNISSVAAIITNAFVWLHYGASKGAVDTFTRGLALEVAEQGIRVNGVRPGLTETDINPPGRIESLAAQFPLKRAAQPEEIAEAAIWLLSDKAGYCTGSILNVAGGRGSA